MRDIGRPWFHARDVRQIDDLPFGPPQMRNRPLRDEKHRAQVEVERCVPTLRGDSFHRFARHDRGRVDHDVESLQGAGGLIRESARRRRIGEIRRQQLGPPTCRPHRARRLLRALC